MVTKKTINQNKCWKLQMCELFVSPSMLGEEGCQIMKNSIHFNFNQNSLAELRQEHVKLRLNLVGFFQICKMKKPALMATGHPIVSYLMFKQT